MIKSISIILPLFNEAQRLNKTFNQIIKFSKKKTIKSKEFIFVDDGSSDRSVEMVENFINKNRRLKTIKLKLIKLKKNLGKGGALKSAIKRSEREWILTTDIDFSVSLFELEKWLQKKYISNSRYIYFGSRSHHNSKVNSKIHRKVIGYLLSHLISLILGVKIKDTQCGFKLYKTRIAKKIFSNLKFFGYEHDIEIVLLSKKFNLKITELPVTWRHVKLSKINLFIDPLKMLFKILSMAIKY